MRQSVRALSWTITIAMILVALFLGTAVYSIFQTLMTQGFGFGGFQPYPSEDGVVISFSLYINNTGYYDISDINLTTCIRDFRGAEISSNSTTVDIVKVGGKTPLKHNMSVSFGILENLSYLLFEDGNFTMDTYVGMRYAYAFYFQLQIPNMSMPWGAPFYNLTIGEPPTPSYFNTTHYLLAIPLSLENHAFFSVTGMVRLEIRNSTRDYVGSGTTVVDISPESPYNGLIEVFIPIDNIPNLTDTGYVYIYFENPVFSFEEKEIPYG